MNRLSPRRGIGAAALVPLVTLSLSLALAGCGGSGGGSAGAGTGRATVVLVDAPPAAAGGAPAISKVEVTIDRVEANVNGAWTPVSTTPRTFSLLDLVHDEAILGSADLPAGHYTQVRLFPSLAKVTDADGTFDVDIPSAVHTGIKLNVDYDISPNQVTTILLDFNVAKSIHRLGNGQYHLQPVIPAVVKVLSGTISGRMVDATSSEPVAGAVVTATYTTGSAYPLGTEVNSSTSGAADGTFHIWALLPGTYSLTVTSADGTKTATKTDVVVTADHDTATGDISL